MRPGGRPPAGFGSRRGRAAHAQGDAFQAELDATHAALAAAGVPLVLSRGNPRVGGTPATGLFYAGKGDVDYVGTLEGRPVAFDAKSEAGAASYRHLERDMHELDFLLDFRRRGRALAFLLVRDVELGRVYLVEDLAPLRAGGAVALRAHARDGAAPLVPALERTEQERLLAQALGRPVWDWVTLLRSIAG